MAVALYARVSTAKQHERDLSIPDQIRQMRDWCKQNGYLIATEYVEQGLSATNDRRPEFQQMIAEACTKPSPFEAIVVHSLSRFFRDQLELGLYERQLKKYGVKLISITQITSDDAAGEMMRQILSMFDGYQSKENAKHTMRAMKENARQGFFNGSKPPFGYKVVEADMPARNGNKKRLEIEPTEAEVVKNIFALYLGKVGKSYGIKGIASHLNSLGMTARGRRWARGYINKILSNTAYIGEYYFNKTNAKSRKGKPETEWVLVKVPEVIDKETFENARERREERQPSKQNPAQESSPTLLTGLLKCGECGAGMTLATGKSGRYRYYKCTNRINKGNELCKSKNIPMDKLDEMILKTIGEKIFTPARVLAMIKELQKRMQLSLSKNDDALKTLRKEMEELKLKMDRLCEALENGLLPQEVIRDRSQNLQVRRQAILKEMAGLKRRQELPFKDLGHQKVYDFCQVLNAKLHDPASNFGKEYLKMLVEEICVEEKEIKLKGKLTDIASAVNKTALGLTIGVPRAGNDWLPNPDSNQGHGG